MQDVDWLTDATVKGAPAADSIKLQVRVVQSSRRGRNDLNRQHQGARHLLPVLSETPCNRTISVRDRYPFEYIYIYPPAALHRLVFERRIPEVSENIHGR